MPCILLGLLSPTHNEVSVFVVFVLITICRSDTGVVLCCISKSKIAYVYIDAPRIFFSGAGSKYYPLFLLPLRVAIFSLNGSNFSLLISRCKGNTFSLRSTTKYKIFFKNFSCSVARCGVAVKKHATPKLKEKLYIYIIYYNI